MTETVNFTNSPPPTGAEADAILRKWEHNLNAALEADRQRDMRRRQFQLFLRVGRALGFRLCKNCGSIHRYD